MQRELKHSGSPEGIAKKGTFRRAWNHLMDLDKSETLNAFMWIKANIDLCRGNWSSGHPGGLGDTSGWGVKVLERALRKGDDETRVKAAKAMGYADYHRPLYTAPALLSAMEGDPSEKVRLEAADSLSLIAYQATHKEYEWEVLVPRLENLLGDVLLREKVLSAICSILEYRPYPNCEALLEKSLGILVEDDNENMEKRYIHTILGRLGAHGIPGLVKAIGDANAKVRRDVAHALDEIAESHPEEVASAIVEFVNGKDGDRLAVTDSFTGELFNGLHEIMLKCGERMENAAA